jgi:PEP-CTERM putative exosortase interaction domain
LIAALSVNAGDRVYNVSDDGDWLNSANWSSGIPGIEDTGNIGFNVTDPADGKTKTTTLNGGGATYTVDKLTINQGTVIIKDAIFNLNGWLAMGNAAGAYQSELILESGTVFTQNILSIALGDSAGVTTAITVRDGAQYVTSQFIYVGYKTDAIGILNVEKGGTVTVGNQFRVGEAVDTTGIVNIRGDLILNSNMGFANVAGSTATMNIYGSGSLTSNAGVWLKAGGTITFHMEDISADKIAKQGDALPTNYFWNHGTGAFNDKFSELVIDFDNFSMDSSASFLDGETYLVGLMLERGYFPDALISVIKDGSALANGDKISEEWTYDSLYRDGNNIYAVLTYTYVPEPSTYAAIFGALALAIAVYRRRK